MKKAHIYAQLFFASRVVRVLCGACALWATSLKATPQTTPAVTKPAPAVRVVTAKQGRAIVDAALQEDQPARGSQDCSHLVHDIYSLAGYDYPYASSFELYAGHQNFRRVRYPQAGDLVAWPGHVGIVLEPRQHTFYSLVRSGLQAEDYQGPYWRSRGKPRFYRYVLDAVSRVEMAQAKHASPPRAPATARSSNASEVAERSEPENSSSKPAVLHHGTLAGTAWHRDRDARIHRHNRRAVRRRGARRAGPQLRLSGAECDGHRTYASRSV